MNLPRSASIFVAVLLFAATTATAPADRERRPYPYVVASVDGRHFFRMRPDPERPVDSSSGLGEAYRVSSTPSDERLWTTEGWYAFAVFLSHDGRFLVRIGNWPQGREPSASHLAIAFYDEGDLIRSYSTKGLIPDPSKLTPSVSHYQFLGTSAPGFVQPYGHIFELHMADGARYTFDVRTGAIVDSLGPG